MSGTDRKWSCIHCTYINFNKALKCTMCSMKRQTVQLIIDDMDVNQKTSQDIYKMSSLNDSGFDDKSNQMSLSSDRNQMNRNDRKWSCISCTFLNYNKSLKCTQCLTPRKGVISSPKPETDGNEEPNESLADNEVIGSENNTISNDSYYNAINDKNKTESNEKDSCFKWSCSACTYDNWPLAKKCVLCLKLRQTITLSDPTVEGLEEKRKESRKDSPLPPMPSIAAKDCSHNCSDNELNIINNKLNENLSDISSTANEPYIEASRDQMCNELYDFDLLIGQTSRPVAKRVPSDVSPYLAAEIRRLFSSGLKQRKGEFGCHFVTEFVTFSLPAEIEDLSPQIQERLFDEYLDRDVQKELEDESPIINWSLELTERLGSRLYALWNRSTGDCLLDSVLQATFGIFDRDNRMRKALGDSLSEGSSLLFPRFKEAETLQANLLHFTLDDDQWREDWAVILSLASQPGQSLEQIHIFTLAHILRRPIIVYAIRIVKSFRGDSLGYAGYEGIYLPLLWESSFCWKSPIALGYTRGHFSALVPIEPEPIDEQIGAGANFRSNDDNEVIFLPLVTSEHQLLPLHFLGHNELGREEDIIRIYMDCCVTSGGILAAKQKIPRKPLLMAQMLDEWLDFYRNLPQKALAVKPTDYSSDDSDQEI